MTPFIITAAGLTYGDRFMLNGLTYGPVEHVVLTEHKRVLITCKSIDPSIVGARLSLREETRIVITNPGG